MEFENGNGAIESTAPLVNGSSEKERPTANNQAKNGHTKEDSKILKSNHTTNGHSGKNVLPGTTEASKKREDTPPPSPTEPITYPLLINNAPHHTKTSFPVYNPATGEIVHQFSCASVEDADIAIAAAKEAFPNWSRTKPAARRDIFFRAAQLMKERHSTLLSTMISETGATPSWAAFNLNLAHEMLLDTGCRISSSLAGSIPTTSADDTSALILREPYGVILAIAPWNAPFILGVRSIAFPLAAGNTCILKAPELSPGCYSEIVKLFYDAGLPRGVLNLLAHDRESAAAVTERLIASPVVKKINFTGSTMVGRIVAETCGRFLKPVLLELGGKAPAIVWRDADVELAAMECAIGAFLAEGQICMSTERIIVHTERMAEFEEAFKKAVEGFAPATQEPGCLVSGAAVDRNRNLVKDAIGKGASVLVGNVESAKGARMSPVVLKGVTREMDIYSTESFGPTVSLMSCSSEAEALELANDTEYGLAAAIFTSDLKTGLRFARGIETGACHINHMTVHDETALPHGGVKSSGYGRFGAGGMDEWVRTKTVTFRE